jgi:hypothetical protein
MLPSSTKFAPMIAPRNGMIFHQPEKTDFSGFKKVFGSEQSKGILSSFLNAR